MMVTMTMTMMMMMMMMMMLAKYDDNDADCGDVDDDDGDDDDGVAHEVDAAMMCSLRMQHAKWMVALLPQCLAKHNC